MVEDMFVDAHAHLDKYDAELPAIIQEIEANQIFTLSVSMDVESYLKSKQLDAKSKWILSTFGIHPWNAPAVHRNLESLDALIADSPMIGEIGLDYHFVKESEQYGPQLDVFEYFVRKGVEQNKILNIHSKGAEADVDSILGNYNAQRAIVHWYSGTLDILKKLTDKGIYITVGVEMLTDPHIQAIAKAVPAELLLTETDNPGGYRWLTGTMGKPVLIKSVVEKLSELRGWEPEQTRARIFESFMRLAVADEWAQRLRSRLKLQPESAAAAFSRRDP
jgi:TatD DNase family protein